MPRGAWIRFDSFHSAPLAAFTSSFVAVDADTSMSIDAASLVRTAMSSQGLTFNGGVVADLRRAGGMDNGIWWLKRVRDAIQSEKA